MSMVYTGEGRSVAGLPARDLTSVEVDEYESREPGFIAMVEAGDVEDGPTPIYRPAKAGEARAIEAAAQTARDVREHNEAVKMARRRGESVPDAPRGTERPQNDEPATESVATEGE